MPFPHRPSFLWRLRTRSLTLGPRTVIMGILNVTPDSFSDGGTFYPPGAPLADPSLAIQQGLRLLDRGAHILDLGGESTRPNATPLTPDEEQSRVLPVLTGILAARPTAILSIDTYHAATARLAIQAGAEIVNDVSGHLWDPAMSLTCAELGCGAVLMHTRGRPTEWQSQTPLPPRIVVESVQRDLAAHAQQALAAGVARDSMVLDPGFGFGKRGDRNYPLLARFADLHTLGFPLLAGLSRKGFLAETIAPLHHGHPPPPTQRLHVTLAAQTAAILAGAHILRVHDLAPAREAAAIADAILNAG